MLALDTSITTGMTRRRNRLGPEDWDAGRELRVTDPAFVGAVVDWLTCDI